jgi:hypothetical protein
VSIVCSTIDRLWQARPGWRLVFRPDEQLRRRGFGAPVSLPFLCLSGLGGFADGRT